MDSYVNKLVYPKAVWMTVTHNCNFNCKWCYAKEYCKSTKDMDIIHAKEVLEVLAKNSTKKVIFIGGEPTLYHSLSDLIIHAKLNGMSCALVSNGFTLADKHYSTTLVESGLSSCNISLKGTTEAEYAENAGKSGLYQAIEGYKNIVACGCHAVLSFVVGIPDKEKLSNLKNLLIHHGIPQISFLMEKPSIYSTKESTADIANLAKCCEIIYKIFEGTEINYKIQLSIPFCSIKQSILTELMERKRVYSCCHIMKGTGIVFDVEFNILPCNHFLGTTMNDFPISSDHIIEFWNSSDVAGLRERLNCYPSEKCSNCEYWQLCGGGCFMRWMIDNPQTTIPSFYYNKTT